MSVLLNMAAKLAVWIIFLLLNFVIYLLFGMLLCPGKKDEPGSPPSRGWGLVIVSGFFLYYSLFTLFALPVMYRWRPLSLLSSLWGAAAGIICIVSVILNRKRLAGLFKSLPGMFRASRALWIMAALLVLIQMLIVLYSYQFTLDAAYYVANVSTSLQTDSLNIYNPYTGDWQDHFEMRYFFATYALQDAVMCRWFSIPALIQTKIIMASVVIILTNMLYFMIGRALLEDRPESEGIRKQASLLLMMFFAGLINFYFTTIYTTSAFLLTRTYEGKSILANVVLPVILYIYILKMRGRRGLWGILFVIAFGSTVISNTSNMLVPAALAVLFVPYVIMTFVRGERGRALKSAALTLMCMLPGIVLSLVYVAYVKGMFVFYTYPR